MTNVLRSRFGTWTDRYRRAAAMRGRHDEWDQCFATLGTVRRRLAVLGHGDRTILLLGDDDLLGLALMLTGTRPRVAVVDADRDVLALIRGCTLPNEVELVRHDIRAPLPALLRRRFDEVFTDPPYTLAGQMVFAHRAVQALRYAQGTSLFLCASRLYLDQRALRQLRAFLASAGFALAAVYPDFNRYDAPPDVRADLSRCGIRGRWLSSDLFHYVRRRLIPTPRLSRGLVPRTYDYAFR